MLLVVSEDAETFGDVRFVEFPIDVRVGIRCMGPNNPQCLFSGVTIGYRIGEIVDGARGLLLATGVTSKVYGICIP